MGWQEEYRRRVITAEEAAKLVKSGDLVAIPMGHGIEPQLVPAALAKRRGELEGVEILAAGPQTDFGWFQRGWENSFQINLDIAFGAPVRFMMDEKRADFTPELFSMQFKPLRESWPDKRWPDVTLVVVSPPDENGFCSFGHALWHKRGFVKAARKVVAEVDPGLVRTYGDNTIHFSEIGYFVEREPRFQRTTQPQSPDEKERLIGKHVASVIKDGDTLEIGWSRYIFFSLPALGVFDSKQDLGWHSEMTPPGVLALAAKGVFNGRRKTLNQGKVVTTAFVAPTESELAQMQMNPMVEIRDAEYVINIATIAAHDNMVAINSAISIDLTGQITAESLFGSRLWNGSGGLLEFAVGSLMSKGGRSVIVLPATAMDDSVSRIVPIFDPGTVVGLPRNLTDIVITEYGVARLLGKSLRRRAEELIAIAHPKFRPGLTKAALELFYP